MQQSQLLEKDAAVDGRELLPAGDEATLCLYNMCCVQCTFYIVGGNQDLSTAPQLGVEENPGGMGTAQDEGDQLVSGNKANLTYL